MITADILIVGGGIVGICIAREVKRRHPDTRVVLLEKEAECGQHASGRNSGVIHAGFYYTADSLKARFTRDGNRWLKVQLAGVKSNRNAIGARVVARYGIRRQVQEVCAQSSFYSVNDRRLHFGLGW